MVMIVKLDNFIITDETFYCNWCEAQHSHLISVLLIFCSFLVLRPICCILKLEPAGNEKLYLCSAALIIQSLVEFFFTSNDCLLHTPSSFFCLRFAPR